MNDCGPLWLWPFRPRRPKPLQYHRPSGWDYYPTTEEMDWWDARTAPRDVVEAYHVAMHGRGPHWRRMMRTAILAKRVEGSVEKITHASLEDKRRNAEINEATFKRWWRPMVDITKKPPGGVWP